jgi:Tol biopolymer transport system component
MKQGAESAFDGLTAEQIRSQLDRILRDERFVHSEGLCGFLRFTVEETLQGRGEGIKEYLLGREALGRGDDFDPRLDPIVRVQAGRLRSRLQEYYGAEGSAEEFVIEFPKGSYKPLFHLRKHGVPAPEPAGKPVKPAGGAWRRMWVLPVAVALAAGVAAWVVLRRGPDSSSFSGPTRLTADIGTTVFPTISRDGRLLVYCSDRVGQGDLGLWLQPLAGGKPIQITRGPGADVTPDFSPDGAWIVYRSNRQQGGLYVVSVFGGEERRLTDTGWRPRYSPDGNWIAYQGTGKRPGGDLYLIPAMGGQPRLVEIRNRTELGGVPLWTPDGSHLIFIGFDQNRSLDWWVVPREGGDAVSVGLARQLRSQGLGELNVDTVPADWLGDQMVFALAGEGIANLWRVPVSRKTWKVAGPVRQITSGSAIELSPRVSAAGRMVFSGDSQITHLWGLALEKSGLPLEQLTSDSSLRPGHFRIPMRFSVQGHSLAFSSRRSGNPDVWIKDLAAGREWSLVSSAEPEKDPLLSPDGLSLVYGVAANSQRSIYLVELDRRLPRKICADCGELYSWLPDGKQVLYGAPNGRSVALYGLEVNTGARTEWVKREEFSVIHAAVSPGSLWAAVTVQNLRNADIRLHMAQLEGGRLSDPSRWVRIPETEPEGMAAWSAAGDRIFYFAEADGARCLWSRRWNGVAAGPEESVRHFHSKRHYPWNGWLSVAQDRLVFCLTESASNIWAMEASRPPR